MSLPGGGLELAPRFDAVARWHPKKISGEPNNGLLVYFSALNLP
jgi:hypothetical protein